MLAKLYISPTSTPEKLSTVHDLVTEAIEARIASDAPSRNALNKLLTALTKAIGVSAADVVAAKNRDNENEEERTAGGEDGATAGVEESGREEREENSGGGEKMEVDVVEMSEVRAKDSILEELLGDEEEEL